jgi:hypothetical protein
MDEMTTWLTSGPSWVAYQAFVDVLELPEDNDRVQTARQNMLADPRIQALIVELAQWPGRVLKRHNDADHPLHKLVFLADLGLKASDPGMGAVIERILAHRSPEGVFQVLVNIKPAYGGTGKDQLAWMLCDTPLVNYALLKFGLGDDECLRDGIEYLTSLVRKNGWPCGVSPNLGKFRGPGRKADPCPYANLIMLKMLSQCPERYHEVVSVGAERLLSLWKQRKERRPYLFAMGTGFNKLKTPLIWYDLLNLVDVLTSFPWQHHDPRLSEMLDILQSKADGRGRFTPESIWTAWKDWEFGQKKQPSAWMTLIASRALKRTRRLILQA